MALIPQGNPPGIGPVTLDTGIPVRLVATATGVGTAFSYKFTAQPRPMGGSKVLTLVPVNVVGTFTVLVLEVHGYDAAGNLVDYAEGISLLDSDGRITSSEGPNLVPGQAYLIEIDQFVGGTSFSLDGVVA